MKRLKFMVMGLMVVFNLISIDSKAQAIADAIAQLALDYQKLAGMKSVLQQMYKGYEVVSKGYNSVKNISKGNYDLHRAFLDGQMVVSPAVRNYTRIKDIISDQSALISEYKSAANTFKHDKHISPDEIDYVMDVYNNLVSQSLQNLSELNMAMSDNKLRMSDNERIQVIDHVYATGHDQLAFLRQFNEHTKNVAIERSRQTNDLQTIQKLYGVH
jgi:hypothetical protein